MKTPTKSTLTRKLDDLAREICKKQNEVSPPDLDSPGAYRCQKCGYVGPWGSIQWAHIERRGKKALRWDSRNSLALCSGPGTNSCHYWFDNNTIGPSDWLKEAFPAHYAYLAEEVDGAPRNQSLFLMEIPEMQELVEELKRQLKEADESRAQSI